MAGSGINGDTMIGATDDDLIALNIDFATGQPDDNGDSLGCENLGLALLKLGGLDPQNFLPDIQVLEALIR